MNERPLRVCHLGKYYPPAPGGIESVVQTLARAQAALGMDVHVLCVNHAGKTDNISSGVKVGRSELSEDRDGPVRVTRLGRTFSAGGLDICRGLFAALRKLTPEHVDVVHMHTPNPTMMLPLAMLKTRVPLIIMHHSDIVKQKIRRLAVAPFESSMYRRAAMLVQDCPQYIDGSALLQRHREKVRAVPISIDQTPYLAPNAAARAVAEKLRREVTGPIWLSVGRLVYYKGLDTAVKALAKVPGTLIIIGGGPLKADLEKLAKSVGVADRIKWWGHASNDELVGCYHAATAFWFPSNARSEGFGLVQVEAMASGCPVINTNIFGSGVPWVSLDQQSGLTVPVGDADAFAAAARSLVENPALRDRLGIGARERAKQFDPAVMAASTLEIYWEVIAKQANR